MRDIYISEPGSNIIIITSEEDTRVIFEGCTYSELEVLSEISSDISKVGYIFKTNQYDNFLIFKNACENITINLKSV